MKPLLDAVGLFVLILIFAIGQIVAWSNNVLIDNSCPQLTSFLILFYGEYVHLCLISFSNKTKDWMLWSCVTMRRQDYHVLLVFLTPGVFLNPNLYDREGKFMYIQPPKHHQQYFSSYRPIRDPVKIWEKHFWLGV